MAVADRSDGYGTITELSWKISVTAPWRYCNLPYPISPPYPRFVGVCIQLIFIPLSGSGRKVGP